MAFDVLFNFLGSVERLRKDLSDAKKELFSVVATAEEANRQLVASANKASADEVAARRAAYAQLANLEKTQNRLIEERAALESKFRKDFVNSVGDQRGMQQSLNKALKEFDNKSQIDQINRATNSQRQVVEAFDQGTAAVSRQARAARQAAEQQVTTDRAKIKNLVEQNRLTQENISKEVLRRQTFASAGLSLLQSGIPGAGLIGAPLTAFGFQGPQGAAFSIAAEAMVGIVKGASALVGLVKSITVGAFEFSQQLQLSRIAMAGIIAQTTVLADSHGNILPDQEKFNAALEISKKLQTDLLAIVLRTNVTFKEAQLATQAGMGFLLGRGVDPTDAMNVIVRLTSLAKGLGIEGARAAFQIRSALTGTRSQLTALLSASGFNVKELFKNFSGKELSDKMLEATKFLAQGIDKTTDLLKTQIENIGDIFNTVIAQAFEPAGLRAGNVLKNLGLIFTTTGGQFTDVSNRIRSAFQGMFNALEAGFEKIFTPENVLGQSAWSSRRLPGRVLL